MNKRQRHVQGRLNGPVDRLVTKYTASLPFDKRLYRQDIAGSIAHARMLARQGIITEKEAEEITTGLESIRQEIDKGEFEFRDELEDIHMAIEARLIEKIGEAGRKLHTARSRNDQIALDMRLYVREAISDTINNIKGLQKALLDQAEANIKIVMPGYTHLQAAQPVLLAHHLLAYFEMLQRDVERFQDCHQRVDILPLGSGALAGVAYDIDREFLTRELGFRDVSRNSLDAVSDRDFVLEYLAAAATSMMHLSRLAEEIVLWSSVEFDFVAVDQTHATSSSIMPQKMNPDPAELARGKTGRVYGHLMALLTTMKGLPLAYNKDMQEDKEGLLDTVDTLLSTLEVFAGMVGKLKFKAEKMAGAAGQGYILATDLADYLVKKGEPFRNAHHIIGRLVSYAGSKGKTLTKLDIKEYKNFSPLFEKDVLKINVKSSLAARDVPGGTAPRRVKQALYKARKIVGGGK